MSRAIVDQVFALLAGGERGAPMRVADILGVPQRTVYEWRLAGRIPGKWQSAMLAFARANNLPLRPEHFFDLIDDEEEPGRPAEAGDKRCLAAVLEPIP